MSGAWRYAVLLVAGVAVALAVLFPQWAVRLLIEPVADVLWAMWRVIASVDQRIYWGALTVGYLLLIIRVLPFEQPSSPGAEPPHGQEPHSPLERWQTLMKEARQGGEFDAALRESLRELLVSTLSGKRNLSPSELEVQLATERISLSPETRRYLFPPAATQSSPSFHPAQLLSRVADGVWRGRRQARERTEAAIDELLQRMETLVEIRDDR